MGVKNLIKLYEKTGEKDKAIASYKKWIDFTNEQNKEIHIKERVKLATEYQLSLHDIENRLLREEALVKDQHISFQRKLNFILIGGLVVVAFLSCLLFYYLRKSRRISAELQRKNLELNELNEKKNEILSIIGHDLRGPIANMLYLQSEQGKELLDEKEKLIFEKSVEESIQNGLEMLDNILEWAKGYLKGETILSRFDAEDSVNEVCKQMSGIAEKKKIDIVVNFDKAEVFANKALFEIILRNLLANSIKFSPVGGRIELDFKEDDVYAAFYVKDFGGNMPKETAEIINQNLKTKIQSTAGSDGERGSGLGLQFAADFAGRMGGKLYVKTFNSETTIMALELKK